MGFDKGQKFRGVLASKYIDSSSLLLNYSLHLPHRIRRWHLELSQILCRVSVLNNTDQRILTGKMFTACPLNHTVYCAYNSEAQTQSLVHNYKEQYQICHSIFTHCTTEHFPGLQPSSDPYLMRIHSSLQHILHIYVSLITFPIHSAKWWH